MNRDLDTKIARELFGWKRTWVKFKGYAPITVWFHPEREPDTQERLSILNSGNRHVPEYFFVPRYSADRETALALAEHVKLPHTPDELPEDPQHIAAASYHYYLYRWYARNYFKGLAGHPIMQPINDNLPPKLSS